MGIGKKDPKGKTPMRRVSIADEEAGPRSPPPSPGPSNYSRYTAHGSPTLSHASTGSRRSRSIPQNSQPTTSAPSSSAPAPAPVPISGTHIPANPSLQTPAHTFFGGQQFGNWGPYFHRQGFTGPIAPIGTPFAMASPQPAAPAPPPVNPPDELGPPPPPPPPPAIPPVVNPFGVHFQPQVPGTEMGPMIHRYVPRHDAAGVPGMFYSGQQMSGVLANGTTLPMLPLSYSVAPATAPMNPIVIQQPAGHSMIIPNQPLQGGPPLMLPGAAQTAQVPGNPSLIAGLHTQPPVHVEPAMGVGLTPNETIAQNIRIAQNNKAYEPQDFKPADPDPYRMYWFRELNGHWAVFPRRQIDRLDARWYRTDDGVFYAIRLSE